MQTRLARWLLGLLLLGSWIMVSLSPLHRQYAPVSWGSVALGSVLALVVSWRYKARAFHLVRNLLLQRQTDEQHSLRFSPLDLAMLATIASATTQALVAVNLPASRYWPINDTPGIGTLYLACAGILAFLSAVLAARLGDKGRTLTALLAAGLFSSTLYLRAFATPEAGPVYGPVFAFALLAAATHWDSRPAFGRVEPRHRSDRAFAATSLVFLAAVALAVLFSPVPRQSLDFWLRWAALLALPVLLSRFITNRHIWRTAAWGIVILAGVLPVLLACLKFLSLIPPFGFLAGLSYRLHPNEFGGANLIARSVLCVVPLALSLLNDLSRRARRWASLAIVAASVSVMLYARSWEGFFALLVSLAAYGVVAYWQEVKRNARRWLAAPWRRWLAPVGVAILAVILAVLSIQAAKQLNIYSFNGRLIHWYGALLAWQDHPWIGNGPGNDFAYLPYADRVGLFVDTQVTYDAPLRIIPIQAGRSLHAHAHSLLLGLGATGGLVTVLGFGVLLISVLAVGLRVWRRSSGLGRVWIAGCLAGIVGALAWGILDVLWVTPPFFSFPVWALIGLLLAASRIRSAAGQKQSAESATQVVNSTPRWSTLPPWLLVVLAVLTVLLPALASAYYSAGFSALQEHRWSDAASHLETSAKYGWLDPQPLSLLAETYLALGDREGAQQAYRQAAALKSGFSPYLSQLGWLAWVQGDPDQAIQYFEQTVEQDPAEIGRYGLHADLGLAHVAEGRYNQALGEIKQGIKLFPESVLASDWTMASADFADAEPVLDQTYAQAPSSELDKRILAHLGVPDITERLFAPQLSAPSPVSLERVLDALQDDYRQAAAEGRRDAALLLAALAEASRLAGLTDRAEQVYLEFQTLQPNSAYGFRDLGMLYREQGRLAEAQAQLEQAVAVSPRDVASRYELAQVYLDQDMLSEAGRELDTILAQSRSTLFHSHVFDPDLYLAQARLYQAQGDPEQALDALSKVALVRDEPGDHLALADLYRQLGETRQTTRQCAKAAEALFRTWPRPLDPQLWDVGVCLAQSPGELPREVASLARKHPLPGNVLLGHVHRAWGELDQALTAYQAAAEARPDEGAPHYFLAETYQALGLAEMAEIEYRQAAKLDPLESLPLLALGRMQLGMGQQEAALSTFRAAAEATPGWGQAQVALGNALLALGDREGAGDHYQLAQLADRDFQEGLVHDLAAELAQAAVEAPDAGYVQNSYFTIDGQEHRVLFMHPDSRARYTVEVPEGGSLAFDVATDPGSWDQPGDGVTFSVYVESDQGTTTQVFSSYIDPKQDKADRRWHPHAVNLGEYAGQTLTLILETTSGHAGDNRFDWAGWGTPRLLAP